MGRTKETLGELVLKGALNKDAVLVTQRDQNLNVKECYGTTAPSAVAGYAVGGTYFDTSTGHVYVNTGSVTSCTFNDVGAISTSEIDANAITPIKMGTRTLVALADAAATPTIAQLMTSSIFSMTPTAARTFTTPTATLMVAGITGATIGSWFDFTILNLSASTVNYGVTLTAGADVTLVGNAAVYSGAGSFRAVVTAVTVPTVSIYRLDDAVSAVLSGVTAGTVAASKAVVASADKDAGDFRNLDCVNLDAGADAVAGTLDIFPATTARGKFTIQCADNTDAFGTVLTNAANSTSTKTATIPALTGYVGLSTAALSLAEMDILDDAVAGAVVNSKAAVYDAAGKLHRSSATPAGAGTTVADATALTAELNYVTGANGTVGVVLPIAAANEVVEVVNSVTTAGNFLNVYAITGSQINALGSTVAFVLNPGQKATFIGRSATLWNTAAASDTISGLTASAAELNYNDIAALGTGAASKAVVPDGSGNYTWPATGILTMAGTSRMVITAPPVALTTPSLGVGVYGTPVVDASLLDNIGFTVNVSTATNKTAADTSCIAAYIGVSNTAATTNDKIQGLLVSNGLNFNCYDAYAVQGHTTVAVAGVSTQNANAHITGLSGKTNLVGAVGQGWVTGVLAILEGPGAVTGLCHVIAAQVEATCTDSVVDSVLFLGADAIATTAIKCDGGVHLPAFLDMNSMGNSGFVTTGGTDCTASAATDPSYTIKVIVPGGAAGYIRVWAAA